MQTIDIIGTLYDIDNTDPENPIRNPLPGWHVNTTEPLGETATRETTDEEGNPTTEAYNPADQYLVKPATPRRVFAGVQPLCYCFPDEATGRSFLPVKEEPTDV